MQLRPYQQKLESDIYAARMTGHKNILAVLATGGGKTRVFSKFLHDHTGSSWAIAHRQELVSQISLALAQYGVRHRIEAPIKVVRWIIGLHLEEYGKSFYEPSAPCTVAGVDTLLARVEELTPLLNQATFVVTDEAHHVLRVNKWGKSLALFPNAWVLGVTATACRTDGYGLGRHADGIFDTIVQGPPPRQLITQGYLTDYRIFGPPSDIDITPVKITNSGDYSHKQLVMQVKKSHIVGDIVTHYLRLAPGKQGITFVTDVDTASDVAAQFRAAGVSAEVVTAKTKDKIRVNIIKRFRAGEIKQLVNVDLFGEGFDVPAVEVVQFARHTASYGLYAQQFGRVLRPAPGKTHGIVIDHVGNVLRHGLPDAPRDWTLDRRDRKRKDSDGTIPTRVCQECTSLYEAVYKACPYCGNINTPAARSSPEFVDGDLLELDVATLAKMRGEVARIDAPEEVLRAYMNGAPAKVVNGACMTHRARQEAQGLLRESISWWAGHQSGQPSEIYRRFYFTFGVDVLTAQTLGRREAEELAIRINKNIDAAVNTG